MLIKRYILDDLIGHLPKKEISFIVGPRQAGKTTVMTLLRDYLEQKAEKTVFLSLDFERDIPYFRSQSALLDKLRLEFGNKKAYVFIDEIQRKENAGMFLKGLYDMNLPYKFIVSGSGSVELKEKIHESLVGRKRIFELNTVSLKEFINFKTDYRYEGRLEDYFKTDTQAMSLFMEYMNLGGYPRVITEETLSEKIQIIDEIYTSYIEKDISFLLRIEKVDVFSQLIKILANQTGNLINLTEISTTLGVSIQTIKNYLYYAEKTFVIRRVTPFYRNIRKELTKSFTVYFYDIGLRNYSTGLFGRLVNPGNAGVPQKIADLLGYQSGFLFQNLVLNLLIDRFSRPSDIHFWRTKDKAKVDFVLDFKERVIPVEVKCINLLAPKIGRSLKSFISKYVPDEAWVINLGLDAEIKVNNTRVKFMPFWKLLG